MPVTYIVSRCNSSGWVEPDYHFTAASVTAAKRKAMKHAVDGYDVVLYAHDGPGRKLAVRRWIVSANGLSTGWGKWEDCNHI